MSLFKKVIFISTLNSCLLLMLIVGTQNSTYKSKVNLLINETIQLPVGFILGISFISGSIMGNLIPLNLKPRKDNKF